MLVVAARPRAGAARLLRRGAGARRGSCRCGRSWCRSASRSATRSRCSTSAPHRSGPYGLPAGCCEASARFGRRAARRARRAGRGARPRRRRAQRRSRPTWSRSSATSSPRRPSARRCSRPKGELLGAGDMLRQPELADALERLGARGRGRRSTRATSPRRSSTGSRERGGMLTADDLRGLRGARPRAGARPYRGREVLTNPPPSAGGILIARALALLDAAGRAAGRRACRRGDGADPGGAHAGVPRGTRRPGVRASAFLSGGGRSARRPTSRCSTRDGWAAR